MSLTAVTFQTTFMISLVILNSLGNVSSDSWHFGDSTSAQVSPFSNGVSRALQQTNDLHRQHIAFINNGVSRALQQTKDLHRQHIAFINNGVSMALQQSNDLHRQHIAFINNEIMRANKDFEAALADVSRDAQPSSDWSWSHIVQEQKDAPSTVKSTDSPWRKWTRPTTSSHKYEAPSTEKPTESPPHEWNRLTTSSYNHVAPSTAKPTESTPHEWNRLTTSSYEDVTPSTAKPTESQPKNWASTTTSSYKDEAPSTAKPTESQPKNWGSPTTSVESTSGKNLSIPKTTKSPLCEPASYSQKNAIENRIVFGIDTSISQHPYQLALEGGGSHICGGSILTEFWALTTAHCVYNQPPKWLAFRAGSSLREEGGTVHPVKYYIYHDNYRMETLDYDVAVVRVEEAFVYDSWTSPVNLNLNSYNGGVMAVATGWGYKQRELLTKSKQLKSADFLTLDSEKCRRQYPGQITERMLCAEDPNHIADICSGDSGGALVLKGSHTLVGIVSWSHACADGRPSVYTNISSVATWIREQVC